MIRIVATAVCLFATLAGVTSADDQTSPATSAAPSANTSPATVAGLVEELGSPSRAVRAEARRKLLDAGPDVLEHLPPPDVLTDPAIRLAVDAVRTELEGQLIDNESQPRRVTLSMEESIASVVAALEGATGNSLNLAALPESLRQRTLAVDWTDVTWWEAVLDLSRRIECDIAETASGRGFRLVPLADDRPSPVMTSSGPYLLSLSEATTRDLRTSGGDRQLVRLHCRLLAEPRLRPLFLEVDSQAITVRSGDAILPSFNPSAVQSFDFADRSGVSFRLDCVAQPDDTLRELTLQGTLRCDVAAATREVRFAGLADGLPISRRHGGVTLSLVEVTELSRETAAAGRNVNGSVDLAANWIVRYAKGGRAFESHRVSALHREVWWQADDGRRVGAGDDLRLTLEQDGAVATRFSFRGLPANWRDGSFVYVVPLGVPTIEIPFKLVTTERAASVDAEQPVP
ncbi:MAG: hypothetical protein R3B90_14770 [Planctomycetaceae bacterium]